MLTRRFARRDECGAVLVTATILLTVLLGIAALVVDVGYGMQRRRQVQNTADAAALAAAQDLPSLVGASGAGQANALANLEDGSFNWFTCTDAGHLAVVSTVSQCISFDQSFTTVRVRVPEQSYPTLFARVLGVEVIKTNGVATARVVGAGLASLQPFSLFSGFASGIACLKQGPSGHRIETCDEPETGNFHLLDITQYGNAALGTPRECGNSVQRARMIDNIAIGADHLFTVWDGITEHADACDVPGPDTLPPRTGNDIDAFDGGLVHASPSGTSDGGGARLQRGQYPKATVMGAQLDNKPIWEFIPDETLSAVPTTCQRATFDGLLETTPSSQQQEVMTNALAQCFDDYANGGYTGTVFAANTDPFGKEVPVDLYDIQLSPRFIYIPQFAQESPPSGSSDNLNIAAFRAVYIHEVFAKCSARRACEVDFAPGPWNTTSQGSTNDKAAAMDAFVLADTMLPMRLRGNPGSVGQNTYVQLVQ